MKKFEGIAKIAKNDNAHDDYCYLTFKMWEKGNKKRIYINDYKCRTIGYIENNEIIINDRQGNSQNEIDFAINNFRNTYVF